MSAPTIDFLNPPGARWLGWAMLVAGAGMLASAVWCHHRWSLQRANRDAVVLAQKYASDRAQRDASRPVLPSAEQRRFMRIAPQLRQPWLPTLRLIENVSEPPVFLLALSVDPATGSIRIDGEAPTFDQALSYMQALDEPGLLGPAELRSHEQAVDPTGRPTVRFSIVTRWSAP